MIFYVVELLDDWNVDVPSWKYPRNLESPRVSSPGFGIDSKMMVMRVDVTAQVARELQRRMRTGISQLLPKETEGAQHPTCLVALSSAIGTTVSKQTVYRCLGHIGLHARRPSKANPQVYVETPLHPEKLTVWCALWAGGIIGPYFFKNDEGHNVTVNGDRYRAMITNFFIPELNNHDVQELWFQQDGATCHTARATIDLLKDTFGNRLISRFGPVNWPPRSCDLTPLDYFLWGYVKSLVYADKPQTLDHLEDNIRRVIADIRPQMLEKVIENWTSRLDYIRASRDSHMLETIFKM
ncbi:uncharacterized protein TNCV_2288131 [Trichonephila clavipes]|nr:uncharacterized protein TNCV_2288131 [Trichonephila clavipes]